ncbi:Rhodanese-like domain-containing protein [Sphaerosporella brunnea]|uniref:Rhodanese-like domain-containing protein n=1 Tax=Sphaerosporella brunnea TaxID=1250544 RepID=A0A5J5ESD8_9PEZI|nr:Rhodanese-like domain-containing protein [Sphaerosporella brunnea]
MSAYVQLPKLVRISPERLSTLLLTQPTEQKVAVVDVRDSDHIGGHIKSSRHVPSGTLNYSLPELVRTLKQTEKVVFHCVHSQERGPNAAQKYIRERERTLGDAVKHQEIYVLDGGFAKWQEKFGEDERLTENYDKQLWAEGW